MNEKFTLVPCPLCNLNDYDSVYSREIETLSNMGKINMQLALCNNCGLLFQNPRANEEKTQEFYSEDIGASGTVYYGTEKNDFWGILSEEQLEFIRKNLVTKEKGLVLDVGCSKGNFLSKLDLPGWELWGLEPSKISAKIASDKGFNVIQGYVEDLNVEPKFDFIYCLNTLEHVQNPNLAINILSKSLKSEGNIMIDVPNSLEPRTLLSEFFGNEHLTHFTPATLERMLAQNDIKIMNIDTKSTVERSLKVWGQKQIGYSKEFSPKNDKNDVQLVLKNYKSKRQEFDNILKNKFEPLINKWIDNSHKIAIYGAGVHSGFLLNLIEFKNLISCFIDSDPNKQGSSFMQWPIYAPDSIEHLEINTIIISSGDYQDEIYAKISDYENKGIEIIKCYEKLFS